MSGSIDGTSTAKPRSSNGRVCWNGSPRTSSTSATRWSCVEVSPAIRRFLRPVSYQDMPQALLPGMLRDGLFTLA